MLNLDRLSQTFIDLCRIPSPSGQEGRVAAYIQERVTSMGLTIEDDDAAAALEGEVGNLFVR